MKSGTSKALSPIEMGQKAMQLAIAEVYRQHLQSGLPLVVWQDGSIKKIDVRELTAPKTARSKQRA